MKKLNEIRDELSYNYGESNSDYLNNIKIDLAFSKGFDAGVLEMQKIVEPLVKQLKSCQAAFSYAYEDQADQYYLNVKDDVTKTLQKYKGAIE